MVEAFAECIVFLNLNLCMLFMISLYFFFFFLKLSFSLLGSPAHMSGALGSSYFCAEAAYEFIDEGLAQ
jgi:hypothetical protein